MRFGRAAFRSLRDGGRRDTADREASDGRRQDDEEAVAGTVSLPAVDALVVTAGDGDCADGARSEAEGPEGGALSGAMFEPVCSGKLAGDVSSADPMT